MKSGARGQLEQHCTIKCCFACAANRKIIFVCVCIENMSIDRSIDEWI